LKCGKFQDSGESTVSSKVKGAQNEVQPLFFWGIRGALVGVLKRIWQLILVEKHLSKV
jgi:hypothetical protein